MFRHRLRTVALPALSMVLLLASPDLGVAGGHGGGGGGGHGGGGGGGHGGGAHGGAGHAGWHGGHYGRYGYGWGGYGWGWGYGYGWDYPWYGYGYSPGYPGYGYGWGYSGYGYGLPYSSGYSAPLYIVPGYAAPADGPVLPPPTPLPANPAPAPTKDDAAHLQILAPGADAEVWLNGVRTKQTGPDQRYKSPTISAGEPYTYEVRARWTENGKTVERTRTIVVKANEQYKVDLSQAAADTAVASNTAYMEITVPAKEAEVWLNGVRTKQTGTVQRYRSPPMTPGEPFTYEVRARWTENGQTVERTRTVVVKASDQVNIDLSQVEVTARK